MPYDDAGYGASGATRDRITQALMAVQNPPPVAEMPPMPAPPMAQAGATAPAASGAATPAVAGTPGVSPMTSRPPMLPQLASATPGLMQPGAPLAPQPMPPR